MRRLPISQGRRLRLHPKRALELASNATAWRGKRFHCHKSYYAKLKDADIEPEFDPDGDGFTPAPDGTKDCLGSAILGIKQDIYPQPIRMAILMGLFEPDSIQQEDKDAIFESVEEMAAANRS